MILELKMTTNGWYSICIWNMNVVCICVLQVSTCTEEAFVMTPNLLAC